ncbi:MAG: DUF1295 domain-containing protein [Acidobacteriota bacterium]
MNPLQPLTYWQEFFQLATASLLFVLAGMFALWMLHLPLRNAALVDFGWTIGVSFCGLYFAWNGSGAPHRRLLLALMVLIWGARLALHLLFNRIISQPEEGRYAELRRKWSPGFEWKILLFFLAQAVSCIVLALPFLLACLSSAPELHFTEQGAAVLWVFATSGVAIADIELNRFRSKPENAGQVCREGLWAWSRHPNYFFEWLIWVSYGIYAMTANWGFLGFLAPGLMLHFMLNVTGIPPTEEQALRSRGDAYRKYQAEVSPFFPLPPKAS